MFYETERIIRKNQKYEKSRAYATISKLENKGLSKAEMLEAIEILLKDDNTESQQSILELAKRILETLEDDSDKENPNQSNAHNDTTASKCPLLLDQRQLQHV